MSGRADLPSLLVSDLTQLREAAETLGSSLDFDLLGECFQVEPMPRGRYRFRLRHEFGLLGFTESAKLPAIRIQSSHVLSTCTRSGSLP